MGHPILAWLLEEENPEVRLRTLKEYEKLRKMMSALWRARKCCCTAKYTSAD